MIFKKQDTPLKICALLKRSEGGFTLLEILLALFIFAIISLILTATLHNILNNQSRLQQRSQSFAEVQITLMLFSRDFEQIVNRPILNFSGTPETALVGYAQQITFTHAGFDNPGNVEHRSTLQRARYRLESGKLIREVWPVLDQSPHTQPTKRILMKDITDLRFSYLTEQGRLEKIWPGNDKEKNKLPRAIQVYLMTKQWGKISQLFIIPVETITQDNEARKKLTETRPQGNGNAPL
jgi:general secretion pathway protein J